MPESAPSFDASAERLCPACDYDLRAATGDRCPECGTVIGSIDCAIPWAYRRQLGSGRAFWRTIKMACRPTRLARALSQSIELRAARRFAWTVAVIAAVPILAMFWLTIGMSGGIQELNVEVLPTGWTGSSMTLTDELTALWSAGATLIPVVPIGILLTLLLWVELPSFCFGFGEMPIALRNRSTALSYFTAAPLFWTFIPCAAFGLLIGFDWLGLNLPSPLIAAIGILAYLAPLILLIWWWNTLRLMARATRCGIGRIVVTTMALTSTFAIVAFISLITFPLAIGFIRLVINSVST